LSWYPDFLFRGNAAPTGLQKTKLLSNIIKAEANKASELPFSARRENRGGL